MFNDNTVALIVPALNEAGNIGPLVDAVDRQLVDMIIIADNGSTDATIEEALAHGATVVQESRRGYGSACLKGIAAAKEADILVFLDGDGSDDPREIRQLLDSMESSEAEMVIGSRVLGLAEPGALTPVQRFGNSLTCLLVRLFWRVHYTDLGPFRAIRRTALESLQMSDPDFGWTIEMQVKAAQQNLALVEIPVTRKVRQAGESKVSGNLYGSYMAGKRILGYVFSAWLSDLTGLKIGR